MDRSTSDCVLETNTKYFLAIRSVKSMQCRICFEGDACMNLRERLDIAFGLLKSPSRVDGCCLSQSHSNSSGVSLTATMLPTSEDAFDLSQGTASESTQSFMNPCSPTARWTYPVDIVRYDDEKRLCAEKEEDEEKIRLRYFEEMLAMVSPDLLEKPAELWMLLLVSKRFRVKVTHSTWYRLLLKKHLDYEASRASSELNPFLPRQRSWSSVDTETSGKS